MTGLRVANGTRNEVLYKRDVGYGQGPGQTIAGGEPYRLDLWWQAAQTLDASKRGVRIQLAPTDGTAATLGEDTTAEETGGTSTGGAEDGEECAGSLGASEVPLPLVAGERLLHAGGVLGASALDSTGLASCGLPGPGRYVTIYANSAHAFVYVGTLRFDTEAPEYDTRPNSGKPEARWRRLPICARLGYLDRATPGRVMSRIDMRPRHIALLALAGLVIVLGLAGCADPYATSQHNGPASNGGEVQNVGEPRVPAPRQAGTRAPVNTQRTPQQAIRQFGERYANWTYKTLADDQLALAATSVG
jgi:hypothetical protein